MCMHNFFVANSRSSEAVTIERKVFLDELHNVLRGNFHWSFLFFKLKLITRLVFHLKFLKAQK